MRSDGDALVLHVGEKPYVVAASGPVELSRQGLGLGAMEGMLAQLLTADALRSLREMGAVEHELDDRAAAAGDRFTVVAARGGDDIWIELRRHRRVAPVAAPEPVQVPEPVAEAPVPVSAPVSVAAPESVALPEPVAAPESVPAVRAHEPPAPAAEPLAAPPAVAVDTPDEHVASAPPALTVSAPVAVAATTATAAAPPEPLAEPARPTPALAMTDTVSHADMAAAQLFADDADEIDAASRALAAAGDAPADDLYKFDLEAAPAREAAPTPVAPAHVAATEPAPAAAPPAEPVVVAIEAVPEPAPEVVESIDTPAPVVPMPAVAAAPEAPPAVPVADAAATIAAAVPPPPTPSSAEPPVVAAASVSPATPVVAPPAPEPVRAAAPVVEPAPPAPMPVFEPAVAAAPASVAAPVAVPSAPPLPAVAAAPSPYDQPGRYESPMPAAWSTPSSPRFDSHPHESSRYGAVEAHPVLPGLATEFDAIERESISPDSLPAVVLSLTRDGARGSAGAARGSVRTGGIERLLRLAAARGASALYLTTQARPAVRVDGDIRLLDGEAALSSGDVEAAVLELAPEGARDKESAEWIRDLQDVGRVRITTFRDYRGPGALLRMIQARATSAEQLGLVREIQALATEPEGLVIVTGPRASGKSTLVSAFVDLINRQRNDYVITLEGQIRLVHESRGSLISQRELRGSAAEVVTAARAALRENPDVLVIEDLRSPDVLQVALDAAGSGLLVFASVTAASATAALERLVDLCPSDQRRNVRAALAEHLRGVVAQVLLRKAGGGRLAARELVLNTNAVAALVSDGQIAQLPRAIDSGRKLGMAPLNDALVAFVQSGAVDVREAYRKADDKAGLLALLRREGIDTSFVERLA
ncbi:MAG: Flp pilus assembly complex ATPase component TadA [Acidobacteria bacterium]|nr:Flp pilus assembly complex ATPase component TadA [Acidobacteriota bacterium]